MTTEMMNSPTLAAQAHGLEPNVARYLATQLQGARTAGLQGLRTPARALLHLLAGRGPPASVLHMSKCGVLLSSH